MAPTAPLSLVGRFVSDLAARIPSPAHAEPPTPILAARQTVVATVIPQDPAPQQAQSSSLNAGAIVGIVLGSVIGFLLLCWLVKSLLNTPNKDDWGPYTGGHRDYRGRSRHSSHRKSYSDHGGSHHGGHHHHHHHHHHGHHGHSPRRVSVYSTTGQVPVVRGSRSPRRPEKVYVG